MPNSSVPITPGSGANIAINVAGGLDYQIVKLDLGSDGASVPAQADGSGFLKVNLAAVSAGAIVVNNPTAANLKVDASGVAVPITDNSGSLTVDAPVGTPVFVRLSDGTNPIATLPVSGTVTANQGTAAAVGNAWPITLTDGVHTAVLTNVGGANALNVNVTQSVAPQTVVDKSAFTEGTTAVTPIAGEYNTAPTSPSSGQAAAVQITLNRGLHANLRTAGGIELGTASAPLRIDPVGTTLQPVNVSQIGGNAVSTVASGTQKVGVSDGSGNAYTSANPFPMTPVPNANTQWRQTVVYTASTGATAIFTPAGSKTVYVQQLIFVPTGAGSVVVFDNADSTTTELFSGSLPASGVFTVNFDPPTPLAAGSNILKYLTGTGAAGTLLARGYSA